MQRKRLCLKIVFLITIIIVGYSNLCFAEEKIRPYYPVQQEEKCTNNFDIANINLPSDPKFVSKEWNFDPSQLVEYFSCRATAERNARICKQLPASGLVNRCKDRFDFYYGNFGSVGVTGYISPLTSQKLGQMFGVSPQEARIFMQAWLYDDLSVCERASPQKRNACRIMIQGDEKFCTTQGCKNQIFYMKAIKTGDIKECEKIGDTFSELKLICQATVSGDKDVCDKSEGFKKFRFKYCK